MITGFKGTPFPWELVEHSWSDTSILSGDKTIATKSIYDECTEETQEFVENETSANFRLLTASPDLLAALIDLLVFCRSHGMDNGFSEQAETAINKALGTSLPQPTT